MTGELPTINMNWHEWNEANVEKNENHKTEVMQKETSNL